MTRLGFTPRHECVFLNQQQRDSCEAVKWNYCLVVVYLCAHTHIFSDTEMRCSDGQRASSLSSESSRPRTLWWASMNCRTKTCFAASQWRWPFTTLSPRGCLCHIWRNAFLCSSRPSSSDNFLLYFPSFLSVTHCKPKKKHSARLITHKRKTKCRCTSVDWFVFLQCYEGTEGLCLWSIHLSAVRGESLFVACNKPWYSTIVAKT